MNTALGGPAGWLLILFSISVLSVSIERFYFWCLWWINRSVHRKQWSGILRQGGNAAMNWVADRDLEMRFAQPFLEAMSVIAPLAGLLGTVVGFSRFLSSMGPKMNVPATDNLGGVGDVLINTAMGLAISLVATVTLHLNNGFRNWQLDVWARDVRRQLTSTAQS